MYEVDDGPYEDWRIEQARRARHEHPPWRDDFTPEDFESDDPEGHRVTRLRLR